MSKIKKEYDCALILTHDLIGGKWKLRILWHIMHGDNRFSVLERSISGITPKVLSMQLKELEASGILKREVITEGPPKVVMYYITEAFQTLIPVIEAIYAFSNGYANSKGVKIIQENIYEEPEECR